MCDLELEKDLGRVRLRLLGWVHWCKWAGPIFSHSGWGPKESGNRAAGSSKKVLTGTGCLGSLGQTRFLLPLQLQRSDHLPDCGGGPDRQPSAEGCGRGDCTEPVALRVNEGGVGVDQGWCAAETTRAGQQLLGSTFGLRSVRGEAAKDPWIEKGVLRTSTTRRSCVAQRGQWQGGIRSTVGVF